MVRPAAPPDATVSGYSNKVADLGRRIVLEKCREERSEHDGEG